MVVSLVATIFWAMLPTHVLDNITVLAGGGRPVDGGRTWGGRRVLGDDKTWRGTAVGTLAGVLLVVVLNAAAPAVLDALGVPPPTFPLAAGFGLALDAMLGDIDVSFIRRCSDRERRVVFPGLDQLDSVVDAFTLTFVTASGRFVATFSLPVLVVALVIASVFHVVINIGAYLLGLKNEPW